ncbi:carbon-nitrogen hydrolase family protein [Zwartia panacis]|uniref:carbon-nitrogen hydrolase family protein n=1 Tax=Zwartia panacis TaxID=2683345 RepID=UPI0025B59763|nr:carbon-nitrogen hydrolase family protein [Zwartia panacis]MDN4017015.1 carbon-nitrogen hydrolase family protein [Zwartia panacis]
MNISAQSATLPLTCLAAPLKVAGIQMVSAASVAQNLKTASILIERAASQGARLVVLPEYFCLMGRLETDKLSVAETKGTGPIQDFLSEAAIRHHIYLSAGSIPLISPDQGRVFNTQLVYTPNGEQIARYDKIHLFNFARGNESYDESRAILAGQKIVRLETPEITLGLSICYDLRFPELYRAMGQVDLILVPSAFTYTTGQAHWEILLRARAIENQCYVLAPAQGGHHENGRRTWGHSMLIDPWGDILEVLPEHEGIVSGTIEPGRLQEVRQSLPALSHRKIFADK